MIIRSSGENLKKRRVNNVSSIMCELHVLLAGAESMSAARAAGDSRAGACQHRGCADECFDTVAAVAGRPVVWRMEGES